MLNYEDIQCPKCSERHFRAKRYGTNLCYDIAPAIFKLTPDPIYKDGVLQNPQPEEPDHTYFECLECHCNFRVESYSNHFFTIDEDKEKADRYAWLEKLEAEKAKRKAEEAEKKKQETINSTTATISAKNDWRVVKDIANASDLVYKDKPLNELIEDILNRLDRLERKN